VADVGAVDRVAGSCTTVVDHAAGRQHNLGGGNRCNVTRLMKAAEVTGAGIAVFNHGKIAYMKAYGFRDKEKNLS
jgi:CubicO group peptidase (beta-lactamase class C family)